MTGFEAELEMQTRRNLSNSPGLEFCGADFESCSESAGAVLILTEWDCFKDYDYRHITSLMGEKPAIYDFRCFMS